MYANKILVSRKIPGICFGQESAFENQVVYIFSHSANGAVGVLLNGQRVGNLTSTHLRDVLNAPDEQFSKAKNLVIEKKISSVPIFLGGPKKTDGIYFLHGHEEFKNRTKATEENKNLFQEKVMMNKFDVEVFDGVYFGTPFTFAHMLEEQSMDELTYRFFTGQCLWNAGQLDTEVQAGFWQVEKPASNYFFDSKSCEIFTKETGNFLYDLLAKIPYSLN